MNERQTSLDTPGWGGEPAWGTDEGTAVEVMNEASPPAQRAEVLSGWGDENDHQDTLPTFRSSFEQDAGQSVTPPKSISRLPDFTSPRSPHALHSPASYRSSTPTMAAAISEDDPEAAFAAALPRSTVNEMPTFDLPRSPSFGEGDFGGFSTGLGDPWGGNASWGGDEVSEEKREKFGTTKVAEEEADGDNGEGWGGVRAAPVESEAKKDAADEDWQSAQRRIQLQEQVAVSPSTCLSDRAKVVAARQGGQAEDRVD